jgi:hypothetical protein
MIMEILSYGGGTQTVAMCCLIAEGVLPKPNRIVCADTGREVQSTWDYLDAHVKPLLAPLGLSVELAPHTLAKVDLYGHNGDMLLPAYTTTGKLRTFCSGEWKRDVVRRYLRSQAIRTAHMWIGFAYDETRRWKDKDLNDGPWKVRLPLVERCLTTADCVRIIRRHGKPLPCKSRCWQCPNQGNAEWRHLRDHSPAEFEAACKLDEAIREEDEEHAMFLHPDRVPLRQANLDRDDRREPDRQCSLGMCFV